MGRGGPGAALSSHPWWRKAGRKGSPGQAHNPPGLPGADGRARDPAAARPEGGASPLGPGPRPSAPRPVAAPEAGTIARAGGGGAGRGAPPGAAPGPPPTLAHPLSHRLPPATRRPPRHCPRSRRRRARHGRPPVPLGAPGGRAARGRAGRPGAPGLLPLRQGRGRWEPGGGRPAPSDRVEARAPRAGAQAGVTWRRPLGDTRGGGEGAMPAAPTRGDAHRSPADGHTPAAHTDPT